MICIVQLLCPERHANLGCVIDTNVDTLDTVKGWADDIFKKGVLDRHCGICGSTKLEWECKETRFKTVGEAQDIMKVLQKAQLMSRAAMDEAGMTYDVKMKRERN